MKEKIVKELRNEYANLGLGEKALSGVAAFLEKTGIKEEDIVSRIKGEDVKSLLISIQGESDSLRNNNAKLTKENEELKSKKNIEPKVDEPDESETEKALKQLQEEIKSIKESSIAEAKKRADSEVIAKVNEILKTKGCTNDFVRKITLSGLTISDGDTAEALADKYKELYDANFKEAYGEGRIPPNGNHSSTEFKKGDYSSEVERLRASGALPPDSK